MAATRKSQLITDLDTDPSKLVSPPKYGAELRSHSEKVEIAAADNDGSIYPYVRVKKNDRPRAVRVMNDAITAGTDYDFGVYRTAENGATVVSKDCLIDGVSMASARTVWTELMKQDPDNLNKKVWQLAGVATEAAADDEYDLCWTANTVGTVAGGLATDVILVEGD